MAVSVWTALKADDVGRIVDQFDATMTRALSSTQMREVWRAVAGDLGPLRAWRLREKADVQGKVKLTYDLAFERGAAQGIVTVDSKDLLIAGLFIAPPATPASAVAGTAPAGGQDAPPPSGVRAEPLTVGRAPWELPGILTVPDRPGLHPAVVLVAGSGPQDRDETIGPNKPFKDIAEGLAARGVVGVRYDKRNLTHRTRMDPKRTTVEEEVIADALAALKLLRSRPEVRRDAIFVLGHSLGALLAPEIASRDGGVAGLILLAVPARPLPQIVIDQLRFLGKVPAAQLSALEEQAQRLMQGRMAEDELFLGAPARYFTDLAKRDALGVVRTLGKPVLLLRGSRDYQVTDADFQPWSETVADIPGSSAHVLDGLNHIFIPGQGPAGPADYTRPGKVSAAVLVRISSFMKGVIASR